MTTDLTVYRDGDRYIIGRSSWQTCYSMTFGVADAYSRSEVRAILADLAKLPAAKIDEMKEVFWTDERFEAADARGLFGPAW